jgi:hypothetical protein
MKRLTREDKKDIKTLLLLLFVAFTIISTIYLIITSSKRLEAHNKYMCATQGFQQDCKTLLEQKDYLK